MLPNTRSPGTRALLRTRRVFKVGTRSREVCRLTHCAFQEAPYSCTLSALVNTIACTLSTHVKTVPLDEPRDGREVSNQTVRCLRCRTKLGVLGVQPNGVGAITILFGIFTPRRLAGLAMSWHGLGQMSADVITRSMHPQHVAFGVNQTQVPVNMCASLVMHSALWETPLACGHFVERPA